MWNCGAFGLKNRYKRLNLRNVNLNKISEEIILNEVRLQGRPPINVTLHLCNCASPSKLKFDPWKLFWTFGFWIDKQSLYEPLWSLKWHAATPQEILSESNHQLFYWVILGSTSIFPIVYFADHFLTSCSQYNRSIVTL